MGRTRGDGIFGPYKHGNLHRVILRSGEDTTRYESFETREAALKYIRDLRAEMGSGERTVGDAIAEYQKHLERKGNKPVSRNETMRRLKLFFEEDLESPLTDITPARGRRLYRVFQGREAMKRVGKKLVSTGRKVSADYHRNTLAEAKTFLEWCRTEGWTRSNALAQVKGEGKRKHGKAQLRIDEARKWMETALALGEKKPGAVAALCTILMGMRASEITTRTVRDLDDGGRLLWIPDSKTEAGKRTLEVPDEVERKLSDGSTVVDGYPLRRLLVALAANRAGDQLLFGKKHWRNWPRTWVRKICEQAGVPKVSAHGMRGLRATLGIMGGLGTRLRQTRDQLGHEHESVTTTSYVAPGAVEQEKGRAALQVLKGGRS